MHWRVVPPLKRIAKRILISLMRIVAGVPIVSLTACGLLFLVLGASLKAKSVGLSWGVLGAILFCSLGYWHRPWFRRVRRWFLGVLVPIALLLYLIPLLLAPDGGNANARVRNCFLGGQNAFPRFSLWNVIPESDQLRVGMYLLPLGDRSVPHSEAARMRSLVLPLYDEMDRDPDFRSLGSVMSIAYRDLFRLGCRTGHYFVVLPKTAGGQRVPCLVFLHGLGGNVKACLWVLAKLSQESNCALIAPTFGFGNWDDPKAAELVVNVVNKAVRMLPLDPVRIYLMGYSNGAMGVTRAAVKAPTLFRGLIYLSPVTEDELFSTSGFTSTARGRRILFLHGGSDERIPRQFVEGTVATLRRLGCQVRLKIYDKEDHWLLFSQQDGVRGEVRAFMNESSQTAAGTRPQDSSHGP